MFIKHCYEIRTVSVCSLSHVLDVFTFPLSLTAITCILKNCWLCVSRLYSRVQAIARHKLLQVK